MTNFFSFETPPIAMRQVIRMASTVDEASKLVDGEKLCEIMKSLNGGIGCSIEEVKCNG
jgi:hypothetical protein